MKDSNLIFLISQPRSGSTLLQKILNQHNEISTVGEPWLLLPGLFNDFSGVIQNKSRIFGAYTSKNAINHFEKEYIDSKKIHVNSLRAFYLEKYSGILSQTKTSYFLDKTPRYYYILDEIREIFPNAKVIILLRNPLAVLSSIAETWVKKKYFRLSFFKDDLILAPKIFSKLQEAKPNNTFFIHYEDLVSNPEKSLLELMKFLNLEYNPDIVHYDNSNRWALGDPENIYKQKSLNGKNLDKWRENLNNKKFYSLARNYLKTLGKDTLKNLHYKQEDFLVEFNRNDFNNSSYFLPLTFYFTKFCYYIARVEKLIQTIIKKIVSK